jgi:hypothetical protein
MPCQSHPSCTKLRAEHVPLWPCNGHV